MLQGFGGVIVNGESVSKKKGCGNGDQSLRDHLTSLDKTPETVTLDKHSACNFCRKHCDVLKYLPVPIFSQFHVLTCTDISKETRGERHNFPSLFSHSHVTVLEFHGRN